MQIGKGYLPRGALQGMVEARPPASAPAASPGNGMPWAWMVALLLPYILLSSWIGLTRDSLWRDAEEGWEFFRTVWGSWGWPTADIVFVVGSALVGLVTFGLLAWTSRWRRPAALAAAVAVPAVSILANWVVYAMSFMALEFDPGDAPPQDLGESFRFVWDWGWPGLVWVAVLVSFVALWRLASRPQAGSNP